MEKFMSFVVVFGVVAAVLLQRTAAQTAHVVGGSSLNWTIPSTNSAYDTWAASEKFMVGDTLVFNFATNAHNVLEVQKESYDACSSDKAIGSTLTTGPATINLNSTGNHYYICTVGQHCKSGQKLSINVSAASTASAPKAGGPSSQTTPPASAPKAGGPSSQTTPPASAPKAGGPSGQTTPPASAPKAGGPSGQTTPPPSSPPPPPPTSPGSSPSGVFVSFFVCFFSIAIGFLF